MLCETEREITANNARNPVQLNVLTDRMNKRTKAHRLVTSFTQLLLFI